MKAALLLPIIAAALFPLAASAHDCSGGADGGMDATGNQCNRESVEVVGSSNRATSALAGLASVNTRPTASRANRATKGKVVTRNASVRPPVKHG